MSKADRQLFWWFLLTRFAKAIKLESPVLWLPHENDFLTSRKLDILIEEVFILILGTLENSPLHHVVHRFPSPGVGLSAFLVTKTSLGPLRENKEIMSSSLNRKTYQCQLSEFHWNQVNRIAVWGHHLVKQIRDTVSFRSHFPRDHLTER